MTPDEALAHSAAAVGHDLAATGVDAECARRSLADALAARRWWVDQWPEGAEHLPGLVAQDVQEAVQERADRLWPCCREHGDHPLLVEPDLGPDPFWVCHRTGLPVAPVGSL